MKQSFVRTFFAVFIATSSIACSSSDDDDDSVDGTGATDGGDGDGDGSGPGPGTGECIPPGEIPAVSTSPAEGCHAYCAVYASNDSCESTKTAETCATEYFKCDTEQQFPGDSEECIAATVAKWDCWRAQANNNFCDPGDCCEAQTAAIPAACK